MINFVDAQSKGKCSKCNLKAYRKNNYANDLVSSKEYEEVSRISNVTWKQTAKGGGQITLIPAYIMKKRLDNGKTDTMSEDYIKHRKKVKEFQYNDVDYSFSEPIKFTFMKEIEMEIAGKIPDCLVVMTLEGIKKKEDDKSKYLKIYVPFFNKEKLTPASDFLVDMITQCNEAKATETKDKIVLDDKDDNGKITSKSIKSLVPEKGDFYQSYDDKTNTNILIVKTLQAIPSSLMGKVYSLFDVAPELVEDITKKKGKTLNISEYYTNKTKVVEGMFGGGRRSVLQEGMATKDSEIYIDCRPVGKDDEEKQVTVKWDTSFASGMGTVGLQALILIVCILFSCAILYGIHYVFDNYAKTH